MNFDIVSKTVLVSNYKKSSCAFLFLKLTQFAGFFANVIRIGVLYKSLKLGGIKSKSKQASKTLKVFSHFHIFSAEDRSAGGQSFDKKKNFKNIVR